MKIGANTMIWAGDFTQEHLPLIGLGPGEEDVLGPGQQHCTHVHERAQAAADAERDEDFARHRAHHVDHDAAPLV